MHLSLLKDFKMNGESINLESITMVESLIIYTFLFLLSIIGVITLVVVTKVYKMHDVRNADGQYSWMVPDSWSEVQTNLIKTQELMAGSLSELTVHNKQISKLLGAQTDATLAMFEGLRELRSEKSDDGKPQ